MMNAPVKLALILLTAIPAVVLAEAQDPPKLSCIKDVVYSQEFLKEYPNAPKSCREVVLKDGEKWLRFVGEVVGVKGNEVTVSMKNVADDSLGELTFAPAADARLTVNGKEKKYSSLRRGDALDFWVPESRMGFYAEPGKATMQELPIVKRKPAN